MQNTNYAKVWIPIAVAIVLVTSAFWIYSASTSPLIQTQSASSTVSTASTTVSASSSQTQTQTTIPANWLTLSSSTTSVTFQYPGSLSTSYIRTALWPPYVTVSQDAFSCQPSSGSAGQGPSVSEQEINGTDYCVSIEGDGAAGSIYKTFSYSFGRDGATLTLVFTLQYPQCVNYPDPQMTACQNEETSFNVNTFADEMAQSVQYSQAISPAHPMRPPSSPDYPMAPAVQNSPVTLASVSPTSGAVGSTITLTGSGFTSTNKILFDGDVAQQNVQPVSLSLADGTQSLTIKVPSGIGPDCKADEPCPMYERLVTPGTYSVTVENSDGTSTPVTFVVTQ